MGHTGEEEIDVVASDRSTELRGRMESGGGFGILVGGDLISADIGNPVGDACSATIEFCRGRDCEEFLVETVNILLFRRALVGGGIVSSLYAGAHTKGKREWEIGNMYKNEVRMKKMVIQEEGNISINTNRSAKTTLV